jgi:hypothetical protein
MSDEDLDYLENLLDAPFKNVSLTRISYIYLILQ